MKNMKTTRIFYLFLFCLVLHFFALPVTISAQSVDFNFSPRLWGLDLLVTINNFPFSFENLGLFKALIGFGGGYEDYGYFRDSNNDYLVYQENSTYSFNFKRVNFLGSLGFGFDFLANEKIGHHLFCLKILYCADYQSYENTNDGKETYLYQTSLAEKEGIFQNSILFSIYFNLLKISSKTHSIKGMDLYLSYKMYPHLMNNLSDYSALTFQFRGYLPFIEDEKISVYIANRFHLYYIPLSSSYIPVSALTEGSLGCAMRGIYWCQYEGTFRLVNNLDIRIFFPEIFKQNYIYPGIIIFFDIGVNDYKHLDQVISTENIQYSTGIGAILVVMGIDLVDFYIEYNIKDSQLFLRLRFSTFF